LSEEKVPRTIELLILFSALVIVILFVIFKMAEKVPGAIAGGLVAYLNFFLIRVILFRAFTRKDKIRFAIALLYGVKFLAVVFLVYLIVRSKRFDMVGFLAGFSSLLLGIVLEGIRRAIWEDKPPEESG
jgi:F0F1-type ATP synthase assembly protein I